MSESGWLQALIAKVLHRIHEAAFGRLPMSEEQFGRDVHLLGDLKNLLKKERQT
jgi:hypothetical protein